jgi:hypothetical protein
VGGRYKKKGHAKAGNITPMHVCRLDHAAVDHRHARTFRNVICHQIIGF